MQRKKMRLIMLGTITSFIMLIGFHVISFVKIRSQATRDYELVRSGKSLNRANMRLLALEDGGTVCWEGSCYRVFRLKRYAGIFRESSEDQEYLVGAQLEFTCRGRFPILQRWMKDREDSKIVVGP